MSKTKPAAEAAPADENPSGIYYDEWTGHPGPFRVVNGKREPYDPGAEQAAAAEPDIHDPLPAAEPGGQE